MMTWGDTTVSGPDTQLDQVAAWEYVYDVDPDLTGTTLNLTVLTPAPCFVPGACITDVSLTLTDINTNWISWTWAVTPVGAGGPIEEGVPFLISLDPTLAALQASASTFTQSGGYDVTKVVSIRADERAVGSAFFVNFPAVPVVGGSMPWNKWGPLQVVPEPSTALLLAFGLAGLAGMRRRHPKA